MIHEFAVCQVDLHIFLLPHLTNPRNCLYLGKYPRIQSCSSARSTPRAHGPSLPRAHGPHLPRAHGPSRNFRPSFVLHHFASIPTLVFFRTISRGCLSFGPRFLLCPKVFWLLRRIWTSSLPLLVQQLDHPTGFNNYILTVQSDGNLDDISTLLLH